MFLSQPNRSTRMLLLIVAQLLKSFWLVQEIQLNLEEGGLECVTCT